MVFSSKKVRVITICTVVAVVVACVYYFCFPKQYSVEMRVNGTPDKGGYVVLTAHDVTPLDTFLVWQEYAEYWAFISYYMPLIKDHPELLGDSSVIAEFYDAVENFIAETNFTQENFEKMGAVAELCLNEIYLDQKCKIYNADSLGMVKFKVYPWDVKKFNVVMVSSAELFDYMVTNHCPTRSAFDVRALSELKEKEEFFVGNGPEENGLESAIFDDNEGALTYERIVSETEK